eukprot:gene3876-2748_t
MYVYVDIYIYIYIYNYIYMRYQTGLSIAVASTPNRQKQIQPLPSDVVLQSSHAQYLFIAVFSSPLQPPTCPFFFVFSFTTEEDGPTVLQERAFRSKKQKPTTVNKMVYPSPYHLHKEQDLQTRIHQQSQEGNPLDIDVRLFFLFPPSSIAQWQVTLRCRRHHLKCSTYHGSESRVRVACHIHIFSLLFHPMQITF